MNSVICGSYHRGISLPAISQNCCLNFIEYLDGKVNWLSDLDRVCLAFLNIILNASSDIRKGMSLRKEFLK